MNKLKVFENSQYGQVRAIMKDGEPWFVAADVCKALEITNAGNAIARLDDDEKGIRSMDTHGGKQEMVIINEPGLYALVLGSRKPEAKAFKRWITHEVIPAIRKHGGYLTPDKMEEALLNPDVLIRLATDLKRERAARIAAEAERAVLEGEAKANAPKVLFADSVTASKQSILVGEMAKLLRQNGVDVGQNRMFEWLWRDGYLHRSGAQRNMPTQRAMDMGLFEVQERTINNPDGSVRLTRTPKITGKGQVYFLNKYIVLAEKKGKAV